MSNDLDAIRREFARYNGFYKRPEARQIVYELFRGQCAASGNEVNLESADVGHIAPQSEAAYFEELFPGLDAHNLINLHLLQASANRRVSNHFPRSPLFLHNAISYNIGLIRRRLPKIEAAYSKGTIGFDPAEALEGLGRSVDFDYTHVYEQAVCHGDYHVLDGDLVKEAYRSTVAATGDPWEDVVKDYTFFGIKSTATVKVDIVGGLVTSVSSSYFPDPYDEGKNWSHAQHHGLLEAKRDKVTQDLPDGSHLFVFGGAADTPHKFSVNIQRHSHKAIERALDVLVADNQEKHLVGKFEGKPLYFIEDARALQATFRAAASVENSFGYKLERASFPKDVWFTCGLGTALEYSDLAQAKLDYLGVNREFGCLILKSDYDGYLRQIRKAIQSDLASVRTVESRAEMQAPRLQSIMN